MGPTANDIIIQRRRVRILRIVVVFFGLILCSRLFYLQVIRHEHYTAEADSRHVSKYEIPASRGEIFVKDGDDDVAVAINQNLKLVYADPGLVKDKAKTAAVLSQILGGSAESYAKKLAVSGEYTVLAERVDSQRAAKLKAEGLIGVGMIGKDYRTYPEGSLMAQVLGFVNSDGIGQYGIEQYLNESLSGTSGRLAAKTDTNGLPIATADNIQQAPIDGKSYVLTIDRNIQSMVESELETRVKEAKAQSGSVVVMDPTGAVRAMATYPTYDPNNYGATQDYRVFTNQVVSAAFEAGSGIKSFAMAAGLDTGKISPETTYNDPGCVKVDDYNVCNAAGDKVGNGKTMTVVLRDSLNTGMMFILRKLGGNDNKITLTGKKSLFEYYTNHFGFGSRTGIEQANESAGLVNEPSNAAGSDVNYANMTFGQGMSVTMLQTVTAMAAIANGGKLYQPYLVAGEKSASGVVTERAPKVVREDVITGETAKELTTMLQVVVKNGSGYRTNLVGNNKNYKIAGKTGTAQIPRADGKGYEDGKNIGSFVGFAPADNPKFVIMVRINEPGVGGYAETTTVPVFADICDWLFRYYSIPPTS